MTGDGGTRCDIVIAGLGGQGVVMAAIILAEAALRDGLMVKQGELHGMSQRGGDVQATLRMSDGPVAGDLVPVGGASLVLGLEPVEALRTAPCLSPDGTLVASTTPVANIPDYPAPEDLLEGLGRLPRVVMVEAGRLAREAGSGRAVNVVVLGAAAHLLPVSPETLRGVIADAFRPRSEKLVDVNLRAFDAGRAAAESALATGAGASAD